MSTFSERLIQLKQDRGLLQKDIAAGAGISLRAYQHYEKGEKEPALGNIIKLCQFFNISADYLLCLDAREPAQPHADFAADELLKEFHKLDDGYKRFALEQVKQIYILQEKQKAEGVVYR